MRTKQLVICTCILTTITTAVMAIEYRPIEEVRIQGTTVTALYVPQFGEDPAGGFYNNFNADLSVTNLIPKGSNLNLYAGYSHYVDDNVLLDRQNQDKQETVYLHQEQNLIYGTINFSFFRYSQVNVKILYEQNRLAEFTSSFDDYNYNISSLSLDYTVDSRYSSMETWYKGMQFIYPEQGALLTIGLCPKRITYLSNQRNSMYHDVFMKAEYLHQFTKHLVVSLTGEGISHLKTSQERTQFVESSVIGTYEQVGDYSIDGRVEARYLHRGGVFWDTPPFWYFPNFLLKFSPGLIVGYNSGLTGFYSGERHIYLQSIYIGPQVAVRLNGTLMTVIEFCCAFGESNSYSFVFSANIGNTGSKPLPVYRKGFGK